MLFGEFVNLLFLSVFTFLSVIGSFILLLVYIIEEKIKNLHMKLVAILAGMNFASFSMQFLESFFFITGVLRGLDDHTI